MQVFGVAFTEENGLGKDDEVEDEPLGSSLRGFEILRDEPEGRKIPTLTSFGFQQAGHRQWHGR
jgi:hypothetical protein